MKKNAQPTPIRNKVHSLFRLGAEMVSRRMGSPLSFFSALSLIILWAASGFYFGFNDRWQLIINTGTTIATFLMVILIQNTQYREVRSTQLKLDELVHGTKNARDSFLEIEEESDEELDLLKKNFHELRQKYIEKMKDKEKKKR